MRPSAKRRTQNRSLLSVVAAALVLLPFVVSCSGNFSASDTAKDTIGSIGDGGGNTTPGSDDFSLWKTVAIGPGHSTYGLDISPDGATKVLRSTTFGAYIWDATTLKWKNVVTSTSLPATLGASARRTEFVKFVSRPIARRDST